ncbi:MAG: DUF4249 family protein [Balneola sp.]|nr:MAG: DUF4249 family protein [Balneola sp.]
MGQKKLIYLGLAFAFTVSSCHIASQPDTSNYVVEAFIYEGIPVNDITVKTISSFSDSDNANVPISDATVVLTRNQDQEYSLVFNETTGKYENPNPGSIDIVRGDRFDLMVTVGDRTSSGTTYVPEPTTNLRAESDTLLIPNISIGPDFQERFTIALQNSNLLVEWDPESDFHYLVIESRTDTLNPIFPEEFPEQLVNTLGQFRFIGEPSTDPSFEIVGFSLATYGLHIIKVYRVNEEYVDLFEAETQDSRDLNEPPSNIKNALGVFTAFAGDSVFFDVVLDNPE